MAPLGGGNGSASGNSSSGLVREHLNYKTTPYNSTHTIYEMLNSTYKNPIVNLHMGISRPCANRRFHYMHRDHPLPQIYKEGDTCSFDMNGTVVHPDYFDTGLSYPEYKVYSDNKLIPTIKDKVPDYKESDLYLNSFKLYYKNYAMWNLGC